LKTANRIDASAGFLKPRYLQGPGRLAREGKKYDHKSQAAGSIALQDFKFESKIPPQIRPESIE
jgi:hypothetical protein